jgi:phosphoserine aminotransferase
LPEDFRIYFSQGIFFHPKLKNKGGATLIFESLVYNLLGDKNVVSYANTGHWSEKAIKEAGYLTNVHETCKA